MAPDQLLSIDQVAEYLNVPKSTVYKWNQHGTGPRFLKVGRYVRYRLADVDAWLEQRAHG